MESTTYIKNIKVSPKKLRFLLPEIKKYQPADCLNYLFYNNKKIAKIFYQAIKSAINNAKNTLKITDNLLKFKVLTVEEGQRLKRYRPGSRGTAKPIKKRTAHIKIVLIADNAKKIKTPSFAKASEGKQKSKVDKKIWDKK